jgi:PAS domain S-box-containing protein
MILSNGTYSILLVSASLLIAICASYTTLELIRRVTISSGRTAITWLFFGSISMGCGIWSMHFVGMLAFSMPMPYEYDVGITILSLLVGIIASLFAIYTSSRKTVSWKRLIISGIGLGFGIASMHYTGMAAMKMNATITYDTILLTASIIIAIIAAIAALWIALKIRKKSSWKLQTSAAAIMGVAICGMHYTGMAAAQYVPFDGHTMTGYAMDAIEAGNNNWLATAVVLSTMIIIAFTHLTIFFDYKLGLQKDLGEKLTILVNERTAELQKQTNDLRDSKKHLEKEMLEKQMAQSESLRLGTILDDSSNEIYIFDAHTLLFKQVNKGARNNLSYTMDELTKMTPFSLNPLYDKESFNQLIEPLRSGAEKRLVIQTIQQRRDGSEYPIEIRLQLSDAVESPLFVAIVEDISERKNMEQKLLQAQKLKSIGQLAAGIAHEINTPSQFVGDNLIFIGDSIKDFTRYFCKLENLIMGLNKSELTQQLNNEKEELDIEFLSDEVPQAIAQSIDGVARVSKIVSAMKDFSHPGKEDKQKVDINRTIESTVIVASNEWKYIADLEFEFEEGLNMVNCFSGEINQVVLNMIVNACHAIEDVTNGKEKGCITITTLQDGDNAVIKIKDTGAGMEPEVVQRIFDPFFTTKEVGKGTGQGLSLAYSVIVEKHDGKISVDSTPGIGTTFTIELPF